MKRKKKNLEKDKTELRAQFWGAKRRPKIALSHFKKEKYKKCFSFLVGGQI